VEAVRYGGKLCCGRSQGSPSRSQLSHNRKKKNKNFQCNDNPNTGVEPVIHTSAVA
jgi:hypothetical protein